MRITTAGAAVALGSLMTAGPALADTTSASLKESQKGSTASSFQGAGKCSGYSGTGTLWHFVVPALSAAPGSDDADIVSIAASFDAGSVASTEIVQNGKGANVITNGATTVSDATATLSKAVPDDDAVLVLSHTCAGTGGTTGGTTGGSTGETTGGSTGETTGGSTGETTGGSTGETTGGGGETTGVGGSGTGTGGGSSTGTTGFSGGGTGAVVGTTGSVTRGEGTVTVGQGEALPATGTPAQDLAGWAAVALCFGVAMMLFAGERRTS